jgi:hypothetical protein
MKSLAKFKTVKSDVPPYSDPDRRKRENRFLCYDCGENLGDTHDHIPPKAFFPEVKRANLQLITVPCCSACHKKYSELDAEFRAFVLCADGISEDGKHLMRQKLFSERAKKHRPYRLLRDSIVPIKVKTPAGTQLLGLMTFSEVEANRFLIRTTKALLFEYYPNEWRPDGQFTVLFLSDARRKWGAEAREVFSALHSQTKRQVILDGVFEFYHAAAVDARSDSVWLYRFFNACWFIVFRTG